MRIVPVELTDKVRVWEISSSDDYIYILMKDGEITFLHEVDQYGERVDYEGQERLSYLQEQLKKK